jgi:hypothetical protein
MLYRIPFELFRGMIEGRGMHLLKEEEEEELCLQTHSCVIR